MNTQERSRPLSLYFLTLVLFILSLNAFAGGIALLSDISGNNIGLPQRLLEGSAFPNYLVPGLFLVIVFGVGSLVVLAALWLRPRVGLLTTLTGWTHEHWAWAADVALGVVVVLWIVIQYLVIKQFHPLQVGITVLGVIVAGLALFPGMRHYYHEE